MQIQKGEQRRTVISQMRVREWPMARVSASVLERYPALRSRSRSRLRIRLVRLVRLGLELGAGLVWKSPRVRTRRQIRRA